VRKRARFTADQPPLESRRDATMSKMDDTRAMREARHAAYRARVAAPTAAPETQRRVPDRPSRAEVAPAPGPAPVEDGLCGHRAISGRTCTREKGHAAKSHRYS